jgi:hypothetical protein
MHIWLIALTMVAARVVGAQSAPIFERGELVRVRDVAKPAVLKIVALPDDIVQVDETGLYVNDEAVPGFSKDFLARNKWPRQYVPFGQYLVMGEERTGANAGEYIGLQPEDAIQRAK